MNEHEQTRRAEEVRDKQHAVLLVCFEGRQAAARARRRLETQVRTNGDIILDTVVLQVNAKHKASVYDPRRVLAGTLTAALTWGLFGLASGGFQSLIISAVFGALCGGLYACTACGLAELSRPADSKGSVPSLPQVHQPCWPGLRDRSARTLSRH
jgi:hypothetical protein